ncbi:1-phosphatidylinositol 4,5-bisphosphate phosphodiesterase delta-1-like [Sinocyclocheilus rhinocerous]|uniref:1-phosphatidylinositol 4,5-bisphosphate phosphodiesterase delta-1-like n=1 Tax=Sinocyclocheilus rhinocerous TaxID=307959 RepID=UPI0007B88F9B|nr:PREDICTED: 1-phosphatidylinositol 4,5-bisphosphate phosphodiesterase delta-1-like [Sinocyclocheilus rhinocerous]
MDSNGIAEKQCLEGDKDLQFLMNGGDLLKVRSGSWKKTRYYKLQEDCKTLWHESKKTLKSKQTFCVEDIEEVRTGRQTDGLRKYTEESVEGRAFSILFKSQQKGLDLIASSEEEAKKWVGGLEKVISNIKNLTPQKKTEHWIYSCMRKADKNFDNKISQKELKSFLRDINIEVDEDYAEMLFQKCDKSKCGFLEGKEIKHFYEILTQREEIEVIYGEYAKTDGLMSAADLLNFLLNEQREDASQNDALQLIEKYELDENAKAKQQMTKDGFLMYLHQPEGLIFNPAHKSVYQDMKQPLNHYFISSSHNTYLLEDQLKGPSSTEAYIKALLKGCRCVEMDCWDGSDGEPVIYHGYTLTSKILFKDVIKAIKEYAFKTTEYPVILSLENHCSVEQQKIMAQHLISILGSTLVTKPLGDQMPTCLPSPEELKGRFIVKGKRLDKLEDMFSEESKTAEEDSVTEEEDDEGDEEDQEKKSSKTKLLKLAKELSDIVIYCKSVHFRGFEDSRDKQSFYEMASFKEGKAVKLAEEAGVMSCSDTTQAMKHINTCQEMQTWGPFFVISAQQLPKVSKRESSIVDPIVKVQIYGVPTDMTVVETQYIENNGFNPMWNENFQFNVRVPDLALVRFLIEDYDSSSNNEFIGQYTLPFNCLKNGYHHVPLLTKKGDHLSSAGLFVHIMVVDAE